MPQRITSVTASTLLRGGVQSLALIASAASVACCGGAGAGDGGGPRAPPRPSRPQGARAAAVGRRTDPAQASPPPQAAGLLYMCQKCPRPRSDNIEGREWRATDALGLRFPSPALVTSAAALFERAEPWANGRTRLGVEPESGRFRITVGPGVVRLGWTKPRPRRESSPASRRTPRTGGRRRQHRITEALATASRLDAQAVVTSSPRSPTDIAPGRTGRVITCWSRKSRSAMCRTLAELDYTPLAASGRIPAMVTLTYPGYWETVAPDGAAAKRHMMLWCKRFHREYGELPSYIGN